MYIYSHYGRCVFYLILLPFFQWSVCVLVCLLYISFVFCVPFVYFGFSRTFTFQIIEICINVHILYALYCS